MRCEDCRELLWSYAKEELALEIRPDVQAHLGTCRNCAKELMYVRKMIEIVHELPMEDLPPQYHTTLVKKLKKEAKKLPKDVRKPKKEKPVAIKQKAVPEKPVAKKAVAEKAVAEKVVEEKAVAKKSIAGKLLATKLPTRAVHEEEADRPEGNVGTKRKLHDEESDRLDTTDMMASRKMLHEDEDEQFAGLENVQGIEGLEVFDGVPIADVTAEENENEQEDEDTKVVPLVQSVSKKTTPTFRSTSKIQEKAKHIKEKEKKKAVPLSKQNIGIAAAALLLLIGGGGYQLIDSMGGFPTSLNFTKPSSVSYSGISASDMAEVLTDRPVADIPVDEFGNAVPLDDAVMARGNFGDMESAMARGGEFLDATDMNGSNAVDFSGESAEGFGTMSDSDSDSDTDSELQTRAVMSAPENASMNEDAMLADMAISDDAVTAELEAEEKDNTGDAESVDENIVIKVKNMDKAVASLMSITQGISNCTVDDNKSGIVIVSLSPKDIDNLVAELASVGTVTNISVLNPAINDKNIANVGVIFYT